MQNSNELISIGGFIYKRGNNVGIGTTSPNSTFDVFGKILSKCYDTQSDDRLKLDELYIDNAISTLMKLTPELYRKVVNLGDTTGGNIESGFIAQEIYYNVPELRHLVHIPEDATDIDSLPAGHENSDPNIDPDYSNWGTTPAGLNYIGLIAYLVKGIQEQQGVIETLQNELVSLKTFLQSKFPGEM